ncbi:MAG: hypothetical protein JSV14_01380 [Deltaproteobacteria bacterium]|nr:MAG: hypothetical protein JSV14_01380 [Deltaproteobacteria bacterium]
MGKILFKWSFTAFLLTIFSLFSQNALAGGFYLPEIATPGSVGTAGVANVTNVDDASSAFTNPAGMTYRENDEVLAGMEVLIPLTNSTLISPRLVAVTAAMPAILLSSRVFLW